ncbi:efflux RND transporter periplasmic adaptor subunit [Microvirga flavescens]|uniref:efflux RND transporter periplasmic adaptor subunit n=1 Tax=Microvirga flavescens TaxID=2249811 RepID=UPI000DD882F6|nr:efflux RND transporter periplasmic adaptor subunit [Microvirga flavescens]
MRVVSCVVVLCGLVLPAHAQQAPPSTVPVGVIIAERKPISKNAEFVGRIEAPDRVEIRARVKGFLEDVLFTEGDVVRAGDPLYRIEQGLFEADVQQAQGALERSKAAHTLSVIQLQRAEDLLAKNAGTAVARDQAKALEEQAKGAVTSDEANLRTAQINLGYTNITAPIAGRIGRSNVTKGNVVGPDSGVLVTIVSQDPMYVTFPISQRDLLGRTQAARQTDPKGVDVRIRFSDGTVYDQIGRLNFLDVSVEHTTDTLTARATIPNPKGVLTDGQLVRVILESEAPEEKVVIPQAALIADQAGVYVFVVEDGKAAIRRIKVGGEFGSGMIVQEGLSPGDQVIVEGLQSVRAGLPVRANPISSTPGGI